MIKSQNNKNKKPKEQAMKIVFVTSIVIVLLGAIGIFGIDNNSVLENTFAQEGNLEIPLSAELDGNISTMETSSTTISTNQSQPTSSISINWTGTIKAVPTIEEAFKSKINTDIIEAIQIAQASIGANSSVKDAVLIPVYGLVYKIFLVDENMKQYNVIVDPGNGQFLSKEEIPLWYDDHLYGFGNH